METKMIKTRDIESVLITGDLAQLTPEQRLEYYRNVCQSLGLNPLTRPFDYIMLNGKLTLYARRDAADQLRRIHGISIEPPKIEYDDDWIIVTVSGRMPDGRRDAEIGVVNRRDMQGNYGNALMKAVTKAKRRLTLSMCGLGWLDETEVETIPDAKIVDDKTVVAALPSVEAKKSDRPYPPELLKQMLIETARKNGLGKFDEKCRQEVAACLEYIYMSSDKRHRFIHWLTDGKAESLKDVEQNLVLSLMRWLKPVYNPDAAVYQPADGFAEQEAKMVESVLS